MIKSVKSQLVQQTFCIINIEHILAPSTSLQDLQMTLYRILGKPLFHAVPAGEDASSSVRAAEQILHTCIALHDGANRIEGLQLEARDTYL